MEGRGPLSEDSLRMRNLPLALLLFSFEAAAAAVLADWQCLSGPTFPVEVTIDQRGVRLDPNLFDSQARYDNPDELSACINAFRARFNEAVAQYKSACNGASDALCQMSIDDANNRLTQHIRRSELLRRNRISLTAFTAVTPPPPQGGTVTPLLPEGTVTPPVEGGTSTPPPLPGGTATPPTEGGRPTVSPGGTPTLPLPGGTVTTPPPLGGTPTPLTADRPDQRLPTNNRDINRFLREEIANGRINPGNPNQTFQHGGRSHRIGDFEPSVGDGLSDRFGRDSSAAPQILQNYILGRVPVLQGMGPARTDVMSNLNRLFDQVHGARGQDELAQALQQCLQNPPNQTLQDILSQLHQSEQRRGCEELQPGQHRNVESNVTGGNYLLRRAPNGNFQAVLNLSFTPGSGSNVSGEAMLQRARNCVAQANSNIRGPNGQRLEIMLGTTAELQQLGWSAPREQRITITAPEARSYSNSFASNVGCDTIIHELLHHLGLCDEYRDPSYGPCRATPTRVTIMGLSHLHYNHAVPTTLTCDCSSRTCQAIMRSRNEQLRRVYLGPSINELTTPAFRIDHCPQVAVPSSPRTPSSSVEVVSSNPLSVVIDEYFAGGSGNFGRRRFNCTCPANDRECISQLRFVETLARNPGYRKECPYDGAPVSRSPAGAANPSGASTPSAVLRGNQLEIQSPPRLPSLLEPNHFNKILEGPGCPNRSAQYQTCLSYASGTCTAGAPPQQCLDDNTFLGRQQ
jgi:hypothetical protein